LNGAIDADSLSFDMLELQHLHAFVVLAEELHFGRAARRLRIAQPALSQRIQRLERTLTVRLFERTSRSVTLSDAGVALLASARALLADAERAIATTRRAALGEVGVLRIGFAASGAFGLLPRVLRAFRKAFPDVVIEFHDGALAIPVERLENGSLDVAIVRGPVDDPRLRAELLYRERICAVLPDTHPLAKRRRISLASLAADDFVMFPRERAPVFHDSLAELCRRAGFLPRVRQEAADWQVLASLVAAGLGVTLAPMSVRQMPREGVLCIPLTSQERIAELVLVCAKQRVSSATSSFIAIAHATARSSRQT
jgi:DNA-binding transcriptional LysR family regulator